MNRIALAALLSLFGTAQAADYTLAFSGSGVHDQDYWECLHIGANPDCPTALHLSWAGGLRLSETDGSVTAISMVSTLEGFDYPALLDRSKLIVDTRNALKKLKSDKIVRL